MRCVLVSIGSMGDTLPFVAVGKGLARRGHDVTLLANGQFRDMVEKEGLNFIETLSVEQYQEFLEGQDNKRQLASLRRMADDLLSQVRRVYELIGELYVPGDTVVAAQGYALGARIAQEMLSVPLATVHLQPLWFRSVYDSPGVPSWAPLWYPKMFDSLIDVILDRRLGRPTNEFRAELGLPRASKVMKHWWNSPQRVIGLFPDWYNPPQPDYPPNTLLAGFPLESSSNGKFDSTEIDAFLAEGDPPLVFTQSSVTLDADRFFSVSIEAARNLGRRAVLLTPHSAQVPDPLPAGIRHFSFVPLDRILPRSAAHIHHGGIGAIGHTFAAGIPQLTVPWVYDQPDNSQRLKRLGVSEYLAPRNYRVREVTRLLKSLIDSPQVAARCRDFAEKMKQSNAIERTCVALEELAGTDRK